MDMFTWCLIHPFLGSRVLSSPSVLSMSCPAFRKETLVTTLKMKFLIEDSTPRGKHIFTISLLTFFSAEYSDLAYNYSLLSVCHLQKCEINVMYLEKKLKKKKHKRLPINSINCSKADFPSWQPNFEKPQWSFYASITSCLLLLNSACGLVKDKSLSCAYNLMCKLASWMHSPQLIYAKDFARRPVSICLSADGQIILQSFLCLTRYISFIVQ